VHGQNISGQNVSEQNVSTQNVRGQNGSADKKGRPDTYQRQNVPADITYRLTKGGGKENLSRGIFMNVPSQSVSARTKRVSEQKRYH
jgi:hypothetical protein